MKTKTTISNFTFRPAGHGHYKVSYRSPLTGRTWTTTTSDMPLIDRTKNADDGPLRKDLEYLKWVCKNQ